jgi:hypothetical protein
MSSFPGSPRLVKGGIVLLDPESGTVQRIITLQYNPEKLTRTLKPNEFDSGGDAKSGVLRLKGPPTETITIDADIDAADQLEFPDKNADTVQYGIQPQLAALETLIYPTSAHLQAVNAKAQAGTLEIAPPQSPLALFIWSRNRILPVKVTSLTINEEGFDPNLNPIQAKVTIAMQVLTVDDLGFDHKGGSIYLVYQQQKERLAALFKGGGLSNFGIGAIP